jgi:hypothetical protein
MKKISTIIIILLLLVTHSFAASKVGTTAAQFLKIGVGSRAVGMGGAFVAVADDITSLYWNPGGLGRLNHNEAFSFILNGLPVLVLITPDLLLIWEDSVLLVLALHRSAWAK